MQPILLILIKYLKPAENKLSLTSFLSFLLSSNIIIIFIPKA
jgi:hypothetical protein